MIEIAEVMVVEMIADLNLSMNTASTLTSAFKVMFQDSNYKNTDTFSAVQNKHF